MKIDPSALKESCRETQSAAEAARGWVDDAENADLVREERAALVRDFRRQKTRLRKLETAVDRPMCVGVFGPSQAGKSYLVSVLARPGSKPLKAVFAGEAYDFVAELNPEGGKESTGLVTRFTVSRRGDAPDGAPVTLRLLSEADIIRILANSYFFDGAARHHPPASAAEVAERLDAAGERAGEARPGLTDEDVWEIQDYFNDQFEGDQRLAPLTGFWDRAADLAPKLAPEDRSHLFSILWGGIDAFTSLYRALTEALAKLGGADEAFCGMDGLLPRETSVINVDTLHGLDRLDEAERLSLKTRSGASCELPKPLVTALTAELRIEMEEKPWDFFGHTDLLDFPGARSRQATNLTTFFEETHKDPLKESFLRGKVAYLFDRYVAEQELTSMLLCLGDSNQEVATLPDLVNDWIGRTHGRDSRARAGAETALFLVMTKFDRELEEKAGSGAPVGRFNARYATTLSGFLGKTHEWPDDWANGAPFANTYWLRNPNFRSEALIEYDADGVELKLIESKADRLAALRAGFLEAEDLVRHFTDPGAAWDAAMTLNDGGVSYLAENLKPVCNPQIKLRQITSRLEESRRVMRELIERFFISNDPAKRLRERLEVADGVINELYDSAEMGRFAKVISALQVDLGPFTDALFQKFLRRPGDETDGADPAAMRGSANPMLAARALRRPSGLRRPGQDAGANTAETEEASTPRRLERDALLAEAAMSQWLADIRQNAESGRLARETHISNESLNELVNELSAAARRLSLSQRIAASIKAFGYIETSETALVRAAALAHRQINDFVAYLGYKALAEAERPKVGDGDTARPVFRPRPTPFDASAIGPEPAKFMADFVEDWAFAFHEVVRDNAVSAEGVTVNIEQNRRLGAILEQLGLEPGEGAAA